MLYKIDVSDQHSSTGELYAPSKPWGRRIFQDGHKISSQGFKTKTEAVRDGYKFVEKSPGTSAIVFKRATGEVMWECWYGPSGFVTRGGPATIKSKS